TLRADGTLTRSFKTGEAMCIRIGFDVVRERMPYFTVFFIAPDGQRAMTLYSTHCSGYLELNGSGYVECRVPELRLASGEYSLMVEFGRNTSYLESADCVPNATMIRVALGDYLGAQGLVRNQGWIAQRSDWSVMSAAEMEKQGEPKSL